MKTIIKRILISALIASLLIFPGCTEEPEEKAPSNYAQLHSLLGKSVTEVCQALGVDEAQVDAALNDTAAMPTLGEAQYAGLTWTAYPYFDKYDRTLYGFYYTVRYTENPDQAVPIFMDLAAALAEDYGEPQVASDTVMFDDPLTAENILNTIWNRKSFSAEQQWQLNQEITPEIQAYTDSLLQKYNYSTGSENWAASGFDYIMALQYSANLDTAGFKLTYRLYPKQAYVGPPRQERPEE